MSELLDWTFIRIWSKNSLNETQTGSNLGSIRVQFKKPPVFTFISNLKLLTLHFTCFCNPAFSIDHLIFESREPLLTYNCQVARVTVSLITFNRKVLSIGLFPAPNGRWHTQVTSELFGRSTIFQLCICPYGLRSSFALPLNYRSHSTPMITFNAVAVISHILNSTVM